MGECKLTSSLNSTHIQKVAGGSPHLVVPSVRRAGSSAASTVRSSAAVLRLDKGLPCFLWSAEPVSHPLAKVSFCPSWCRGSLFSFLRLAKWVFVCVRNQSVPTSTALLCWAKIVRGAGKLVVCLNQMARNRSHEAERISLVVLGAAREGLSY